MNHFKKSFNLLNSVEINFIIYGWFFNYGKNRLSSEKNSLPGGIELYIFV